MGVEGGRAAPLAVRADALPRRRRSQPSGARACMSCPHVIDASCRVLTKCRCMHASCAQVLVLSPSFAADLLLRSLRVADAAFFADPVHACI